MSNEDTYYHITYAWRRQNWSAEVWDYASEVAEKHPYEWDLALRKLERKTPQHRSPQEHRILWWTEITEQEYERAKELEIYE